MELELVGRKTATATNERASLKENEQVSFPRFRSLPLQQRTVRHKKALQRWKPLLSEPPPHLYLKFV
jgi:hypothetical protein